MKKSPPSHAKRRHRGNSRRLLRSSPSSTRATLTQRLSGDHAWTISELAPMQAKIDPLIASADPHDRAVLLSLRGQLNGRRGQWSQVFQHQSRSFGHTD